MISMIEYCLFLKGKAKKRGKKKIVNCVDKTVCTSELTDVHVNENALVFRIGVELSGSKLQLQV